MLEKNHVCYNAILKMLKNGWLWRGWHEVGCGQKEKPNVCFLPISTPHTHTVFYQCDIIGCDTEKRVQEKRSSFSPQRHTVSVDNPKNIE